VGGAVLSKVSQKIGLLSLERVGGLAVASGSAAAVGWSVGQAGEADLSKGSRLACWCQKAKATPERDGLSGADGTRPRAGKRGSGFRLGTRRLAAISVADPRIADNRPLGWSPAAIRPFGHLGLHVEVAPEFVHQLPHCRSPVGRLGEAPACPRRMSLEITALERICPFVDLSG